MIFCKIYEIFMNYFFYSLNNFTFSNQKGFILQYKNIQMFLNEKIRIKINENNIIEGEFKGIKDDGSLILRQGKQELSIYSGQILL